MLPLASAIGTLEEAAEYWRRRLHIAWRHSRVSTVAMWSSDRVPDQDSQQAATEREHGGGAEASATAHLGCRRRECCGGCLLQECPLLCCSLRPPCCRLLHLNLHSTLRHRVCPSLRQKRHHIHSCIGRSWHSPAAVPGVGASSTHGASCAIAQGSGGRGRRPDALRWQRHFILAQRGHTSRQSGEAAAGTGTIASSFAA